MSLDCAHVPWGQSLCWWEPQVHACRELPKGWQTQGTAAFSMMLRQQSGETLLPACMRWALRAGCGGRKHWAVKSGQMSWTQMKTEMWAQALSVFDRRNHFTAAVWMELVFNDLRLLSSTTRALQNLYIAREQGSRQQHLEIGLAASASAPHYERGWGSLISPLRGQRAPQRTGSARRSQGELQVSRAHPLTKSRGIREALSPARALACIIPPVVTQ